LGEVDELDDGAEAEVEVGDDGEGGDDEIIGNELEDEGDADMGPDVLLDALVEVDNDVALKDPDTLELLEQYFFHNLLYTSSKFLTKFRPSQSGEANIKGRKFFLNSAKRGRSMADSVAIRMYCSSEVAINLSIPLIRVNRVAPTLWA